MKIIQALKTIKANEVKIADLTKKIRDNSAILSSQTSAYGDQNAVTAQVQSWVDSIRDIMRDNEQLVSKIHKTNNTVKVSIDLGKNTVTKTIDEWLTRRNTGVDNEMRMLNSLTDKGLTETLQKNSDGSITHITVIRHYDSVKRDEWVSVVSTEKYNIDSALEIVNATTDLVE
jgi:DNA uptake protein ComE-like DNA-binding protein